MSDPFEQLLKEAKGTAGYSEDTKDIEQQIRTLFSSPKGEEVLNIFTQLWVDVPLFVPDNPHYTTYRVAQADLVNTIKDIVKGDN